MQDRECVPFPLRELRSSRRQRDPKCGSTPRRRTVSARRNARDFYAVLFGRLDKGERNGQTAAGRGQVLVTQPSWSDREQAILTAIVEADGRGETVKNLDTLVDATAIDREVAAKDLRRLIEDGFVRALEASGFGRPDWLEVRPTRQALQAVALWRRDSNRPGASGSSRGADEREGRDARLNPEPLDELGRAFNLAPADLSIASETSFIIAQGSRFDARRRIEDVRRVMAALADDPTATEVERAACVSADGALRVVLELIDRDEIPTPRVRSWGETLLGIALNMVPATAPLVLSTPVAVGAISVWAVAGGLRLRFGDGRAS